MASWRAGHRIGVLWKGGEDWQTRALLCPGTTADAESDLQMTGLKAAGKNGNIWYALTPDGDVYIHVLEPPGVQGSALCDQMGLPERSGPL
eukprot:2369359-Pyramimonas_sp.AAC.1